MLLGLLLGVSGYFTASRVWERISRRLSLREQRISAGDFPAGVAAPVGEIATVPLRPTLVGFTPRGSSAALLLATGPATPPGALSPAKPEGVLQAAYAMDARAVVFAREQDLLEALAVGGDNGGVDLAALSVDRLAQGAPALRDAAPRTVLLLGRSRGQEALAGVGVGSLAELKGKRLAAYPQSSAYYFALWLLSRAGLALNDVKWVELSSSLDAGRALREGRADAAAGLLGDVELAARDRGGKVIATTADAPHLVSTVLVVRGEFAARYPDAIRRILRGLLDAAQTTAKDPSKGARMLGEVAPYLGDPTDAVKSAPPALLADNLSFFGLSGEAPVTYDELFTSAGALFSKIGRTSSPAPAEETRDLGPLKYVSEARGP